jgi:predicted RecA/RadA family phage recombinase
MSDERNDSGIMNFDTSEAVSRGMLVKLDSGGTVSIADVATDIIGVALGDAASGANVGVALVNKPGTVTCIAAGSFAAGAVLYGRNDGEVDDSSADSAVRIGKAIEAAGADQDYVQVLLDKGA